MLDVQLFSKPDNWILHKKNKFFKDFFVLVYLLVKILAIQQRKKNWHSPASCHLLCHIWWVLFGIQPDIKEKNRLSGPTTINTKKFSDEIKAMVKMRFMLLS